VQLINNVGDSKLPLWLGAILIILSDVVAFFYLKAKQYGTFEGMLWASSSAGTKLMVFASSIFLLQNPEIIFATSPLMAMVNSAAIYLFMWMNGVWILFFFTRAK
jgi:hypothetical protein